MISSILLAGTLATLIASALDVPAGRNGALSLRMLVAMMSIGAADVAGTVGVGDALLISAAAFAGMWLGYRLWGVPAADGADSGARV